MPITPDQTTDLHPPGGSFQWEGTPTLQAIKQAGPLQVGTRLNVTEDWKVAKH